MVFKTLIQSILRLPIFHRMKYANSNGMAFIAGFMLFVAAAHTARAGETMNEYQWEHKFDGKYEMNGAGSLGFIDVNGTYYLVYMADDLRGFNTVQFNTDGNILWEGFLPLDPFLHAVGKTSIFIKGANPTLTDGAMSVLFDTRFNIIKKMPADWWIRSCTYVNEPYNMYLFIYQSASTRKSYIAAVDDKGTMLWQTLVNDSGTLRSGGVLGTKENIYFLQRKSEFAELVNISYNGSILDRHTPSFFSKESKQRGTFTLEGMYTLDETKILLLGEVVDNYLRIVQLDTANEKHISYDFPEATSFHKPKQQLSSNRFTMIVAGKLYVMLGGKEIWPCSVFTQQGISDAIILEDGSAIITATVQNKGRGSHVLLARVGKDAFQTVKQK